VRPCHQDSGRQLRDRRGKKERRMETIVGFLFTRRSPEGVGQERRRPEAGVWYGEDESDSHEAQKEMLPAAGAAAGLDEAGGGSLRI